MKKPPSGWPRISSSVGYEDAPAAIQWLCDVFGFAARIVVEGEPGSVIHSELTFGDDGLIMVSSVGAKAGREGRAHRKTPRMLGGVITQALAVFVDDVDAHYAHALARGATIVKVPETNDYGEEYWADRSYEVEDLEGHRWWFMQRVRG